MGFAKLNVWIRDEKCKPFKWGPSPTWNFLEVRYCDGELFTKVDPVPVGKANVEVEVPPGCYIVQAHVCVHDKLNINEYTTKAIVRACCGQEVCVDLIVPGVKTCVHQDINAILGQAMAANVPRGDLVTTARTLLTAGGISREEMTADIQGRIDAIKARKELADIVRQYSAVLDIVKG
jgi:hypothetical protein